MAEGARHCLRLSRYGVPSAVFLPHNYPEGVLFGGLPPCGIAEVPILQGLSLMWMFFSCVKASISSSLLARLRALRCNGVRQRKLRKSWGRTDLPLRRIAPDCTLARA